MRSPLLMPEGTRGQNARLIIIIELRIENQVLRAYLYFVVITIVPVTIRINHDFRRILSPKVGIDRVFLKVPLDIGVANVNSNKQRFAAP